MREMRADFIKRIHWTLTRMLRRGAVTKEGFGMLHGGDCHSKSVRPVVSRSEIREIGPVREQDESKFRYC